MTTKNKQDEKVLLGLAGVIAVVLIVLGVLTFLSLNKKLQTAKDKPRDLPELVGKTRVDFALKNSKEAPVWRSSEIRGRTNDLLRSVPIFAIPGNKDLIDIHQEGGQVHPGIPNSFWTENGIDPSFKNTPKRDFDQDGFTNEEEFEAKTSPSDVEDYPELIHKFFVKKAESSPIKLTYTSALAADQNQFRFFNAKKPKRGYRSKYVGPGADLYSEAELKGRFKLVSIEEKEVIKGSFARQVKFAKITDMKKGDTFEIARGDKEGMVSQDHTVKFGLKALGLDGESLVLEENSRFDLPSGKVHSEGKYYFKEVKDNKAIIIYEKDGENSSVSISLN